MSLNLSQDPDWEIIEQILPIGYRHLATVHRPNGDVEDLGQNNEGNMLLFRRSTSLETPYSHIRYGVTLSPEDFQGFGLSGDNSKEDPDLQGCGEYSSIAMTNFIGVH